MRVRIETGAGWYPAPGMVIDHEIEDWVIESVDSDPDALYRIDNVTRHTMPLSVLVTVRPATPEESAASAEQENRDVLDWLNAMVK